MDIDSAKRTGARQALIFVSIGLIIAQAIMTWFSYSWGSKLKAFFWFIDMGFGFGLSVLIGVILFYIWGYIFGRLAGLEIIIKKKPFAWVGIKYALATLVVTAFLSCWTGFFREGISLLGSNDNPFFDYIAKPMYWILIYGSLPAIITGIIFGWRIKAKSMDYKP